MKNKHALLILPIILVLSQTLTAVAEVKPINELMPGKKMNGHAWKRATEEAKRAYCEAIATKLGVRDPEFFIKSLGTTFATDNNITLRMDLDETALAIKEAADKTPQT